MQNLLTETVTILQKQHITDINGITQIQLVQIGSYPSRTRLLTQSELVNAGKPTAVAGRRFYFNSDVEILNDYVFEWDAKQWEVLGTDSVAGFGGNIDLLQVDTALVSQYEKLGFPFKFKGNWNALTNSPQLTNNSSLYDNGDAYLVVVEGEQFSTRFYYGDYIVFDGNKWIKVINPNNAPVISVNGQTGVVTLPIGEEVTFTGGNNVTIEGEYPNFEIIDESINATDAGNIVVSVVEAQLAPIIEELEGHIEDEDIHFKQEDINININQVEDLHDYISKYENIIDIKDEPTGFVNPDGVMITYNSSNRTIQLDGDTRAYYKGVLVEELVDGWISEPHDNATGTYFLQYNPDDGFTFNEPPSFKNILIALIYRDTVNFCIRECHGLMQWQVHQHLHETVGTYLRSGGDISDFTLISATATNRRPDISQTIIVDEDISSALSPLENKLYTRFNLSGANTANTTVDNTEIISVTGNQPNYNQFTGGNWVQTPFPVNAYGKIFVMAVPVTADADCQKLRYIFIQPQTVNTNLATIRAITPNSVNLGHISNALSEFTFIGEIIVRFQGGNWAIFEVNKLTGTRTSQISVQGNFLSTVATDDTIDGDGTTGNPLSVVYNYLTKINSTDVVGGYLQDKIVAGSGISIVEGTGDGEGTLIVTNTDKGSDVDLSSYALKTELKDAYNPYTKVYDSDNILIQMEDGNNILIQPDISGDEINLSFDENWLVNGTSDLVITFDLNGESIIPDLDVIDEDSWNDLEINETGITGTVWMKFGIGKWIVKGA
jgi:hypothetical protein